LLAELGHELWIGDSAKIRASDLRKQKTDERDALLILQLLLANRFPRIWVPTAAERDLRQLLWHRHKLVGRRWQKQCDADDPNEGAGLEVGRDVLARLEEQLEEIPARLERLHKAGVKKLSRTDADSRFLRERGGFTLGYTATLAVSEDHVILAQRVTQETNDNALLLPMVEAVRRQCRRKPRRVSADSGFFSIDALKTMEERKIDAYVPDSNLARWLNRGGRLRTRAHTPAHRRMRRKLRDPAGRAIYQRRKAVVEPVIGVLKQQRGMRRFARRGLPQVAVELALAATAYNLTRLWRAS
jgi:hypothetical protein